MSRGYLFSTSMPRPGTHECTSVLNVEAFPLELFIDGGKIVMHVMSPTPTHLSSWNFVNVFPSS